MVTVPGSPAASAAVAPQDHAARDSLAVTALAALGVVYGDIGTSPLYALKECFAPEYGLPPTAANVLGVLSLIFWSLNFVVSFKYLSFIMRADNRGEGGIMALLALLHPRRQRVGARRLLVMFGLFGAALLYGDGVITPAISVLGAVEGIGVATPGLPGWVVPILASVILVALFMFQRRGTARVGAVFGRVMVVWFTAIALLGIHGILRHPEVLAAVNPWHAITLLHPRRPAAASSFSARSCWW